MEWRGFVVRDRGLDVTITLLDFVLKGAGGGGGLNWKIYKQKPRVGESLMAVNIHLGEWGGGVKSDNLLGSKLLLLIWKQNHISYSIIYATICYH